MGLKGQASHTVPPGRGDRSTTAIHAINPDKQDDRVKDHCAYRVTGEGSGVKSSAWPLAREAYHTNTCFPDAGDAGRQWPCGNGFLTRDIRSFRQECVRRYAVSDARMWGMSMAGAYADIVVDALAGPDERGVMIVELKCGLSLAVPDRCGLGARLRRPGVATLGDVLIAIGQIPDKRDRQAIADRCQIENRSAGTTSLLERRLESVIQEVARRGRCGSHAVIVPLAEDRIIGHESMRVAGIDLIKVRFENGQYMVLRDDGHRAPAGALRAALKVRRPRTCRALFEAFSRSEADYRLVDKGAVSAPGVRMLPETLAQVDAAIDHVREEIQPVLAQYTGVDSMNAMPQTPLAVELATELTRKALVDAALIARDDRLQGIGENESAIRVVAKRTVKYVEVMGPEGIVAKVLPIQALDKSTDEWKTAIAKDERFGSNNLVSVHIAQECGTLRATYRDGSELVFGNAGELDTKAWSMLLTGHDYPNLATLFRSFWGTAHDIALRRIVSDVEQAGRDLIRESVRDPAQQTLARQAFDERIQDMPVLAARLQDWLAPVRVTELGLTEAIAWQKRIRAHVRDILQAVESHSAQKPDEAYEEAPKAGSTAFESAVDTIVIPAIMRLPPEMRSDVGTRVLRQLSSSMALGTDDLPSSSAISSAPDDRLQEKWGLGATRPCLLHRGRVYHVDWDITSSGRPAKITVRHGSQAPSWGEWAIQVIRHLMTHGKFMDDRRYIESCLNR